MIVNAVWLAFRYLAAHPWRMVVLVLGLALALGLPAFTVLAADRIESTLLARAKESPILIGSKGNEFDLTMSALYFRGGVKDPIPSGIATTVRERGYGVAVPLHTGHTAAGVPVVGTTQPYFEGRGLSVAQGRLPAVLGEVVVGADVASRSGLSPGDRVRSDLTNLYNLAGSYPLVLSVVGVLERAGTPDDSAIFADIKTCWAIDGHLHGHDAVTVENALPGAEAGEDLEATAAIFLATEITDETRASFHLHGESGVLPATAVLVWPTDARAHDQLLGDWELEETQRAVRPEDVVRTVLGIVLRVRDGLVVWFALVGASTLAFVALVLSLSLRLREAELALIRRIGAARGTVTLLVATEVTLIAGLAIAVAAAATTVGLWVLDGWL
ncbi:MAG: ABC transporter permease [Myxococcota bacterium]